MITQETRRASNEKVDKVKRRNQIMSILAEHDEDGLTAKECAYIMYHRKQIPTSERNFTAPRLTELEHMGLVEVIGKKPCAWSGKTVAVYRIKRIHDLRTTQN